MRRVYQFGLRAPSENMNLVRQQLFAARQFRNDLVAIERGRRHALRALDDTPEVREAYANAKQATKSTRKAAARALQLARKTARAAAPEAMARIQELDASIRKDAYALTSAMWGSRADICAAHMQARSAPLYKDDEAHRGAPLVANDPRFVHSTYAETSGIRYPQGQIAVQLQGGAKTEDVKSGRDTRVQLFMSSPKYGVLAIRVGSLLADGTPGAGGHTPIWAKFPIKLHREIPHTATWKWVRVSCRHEGLIDRWSCEITIDDTAPLPRSLDSSLTGTIAVEWEWTPLDNGTIRVARWCDDFNQQGTLELPEYDVQGIRKSDGIRAVRDILMADLLPKLQRNILSSSESIPKWLRESAQTLHLWKSPARLYEVVDRWRKERLDVARPAYELLDAWWLRDTHLYQYEASARSQALRRRKNHYRCIAAKWARSYKRVLLSDQDLSREARWGEESDVRFTAGISELRQCLRNAFGPQDAIDTRWRDNPSENDERYWCERARDAWLAGGARGDGRFAVLKENTLNAWVTRKAKKVARLALAAGAREDTSTDTI